MSDPLTLTDFAPAIAGLIAIVIGSVAVWHATRGTRALRRQRREAAARGEAPGAAASAGDLARARALAEALLGELRAAERRAPETRAAE